MSGTATHAGLASTVIKKEPVVDEETVPCIVIYGNRKNTASKF